MKVLTPPCTTVHCALLGATLLVLAVCAVPRSARAAQAQRALPPTLLVLPFDLYDYSLDRRATTVVPLHRWVARLAGQVSADLGTETGLTVLRPGSAVAGLREIRTNYAHPTACRKCVLALARHLGADIAVIGQVHKLSNLITYFDIQVDDVRTGHVMHVISMRADGADSNSMWKYIAHNIARRVQSIALGSHKMVVPGIPHTHATPAPRNQPFGTRPTGA